MPHTSYRRARDPYATLNRFREKNKPIVLQSRSELSKFILVSETAENKRKEMNNVYKSLNLERDY